MIELIEGLAEDHKSELFSDCAIRSLSNDHYTPSYIDHPLVRYYSAMYDGEFMGAFMVIKSSAVECEVHLLLLPKSVYYIYDFCELMKAEAFKEANRITAKVFGRLKTMQNMLKKIGFTKEGELREAYLYKGEYDNIVIYGLTKSEWESGNGRRI